MLIKSFDPTCKVVADFDKEEFKNKYLSIREAKLKKTRSNKK